MEREPQTCSSNSNDRHPVSVEAGIDLSFLEGTEGAAHALRTLRRRKERFVHDWRGGLNDSYSWESIRVLLARLAEKPTPLGHISPDSRLAIAQAFHVMGAPYTAEGLLLMREWVVAERQQQEATLASRKKVVVPVTPEEELRKEDHIRAVNSVLVPAIHGLFRQRLTPRRALLLAFALTTVTGTSILVNSPDWLSPSRQNNEPRVALTTDGQALIPAEAQATDPDFADSPLLESLSSVFESVAPEPTPIPMVESLPTADGNPYHLWGIDFADASQAITVEWDNAEIVALNHGEPLRISVFAEPQLDETQFSRCVYNLGIDCSMALNGMVFVGGHSSWNGNEMLAMEPFRAFLEGGSKENPSEHLPVTEQERRERLLESIRPTITNGNLRVSAQAEIVRIEEVDRDSVYRNWNTLEGLALQYDPALEMGINLGRPYVDFVTCGWRQPGDRRSPNNHSPFSSSLYNLFLGETPMTDTFTPTLTPTQ